MNHLGVSNISLLDLLKQPYYNIGCYLMAAQGNSQHIIQMCGEATAFYELKQIMDYKNFIRNVDFSTFPIALTRDLKIVRPHSNIVSAILAGKKSIYYMTCDEGAGDYGLSWINNYPKKQEVIDFYEKIPQLFEL